MWERVLRVRDQEEDWRERTPCYRTLEHSTVYYVLCVCLCVLLSSVYTLLAMPFTLTASNSSPRYFTVSPFFHSFSPGDITRENALSEVKGKIKWVQVSIVKATSREMQQRERERKRERRGEIHYTWQLYLTLLLSQPSPSFHNSRIEREKIEQSERRIEHQDQSKPRCKTNGWQGQVTDMRSPWSNVSLVTCPVAKSNWISLLLSVFRVWWWQKWKSLADSRIYSVTVAARKTGRKCFLPSPCEGDK